MSSELFTKTMKTMGVMVGAVVAFTGVVTLVAVFVVGRVVGPHDTVDTGSGLVPASKIDGQRTPKGDDANPASKSSPGSNAASKPDLPPRANRAI